MSRFKEDGLVADWRALSHFANTLEVSIEQKHAGVTQWLVGITNCTEAYISSSSRRIAVEHVTSSPFGYAQYLEWFGKCWSGAQCLEQLQMQRHPLVQSYCFAGRSVDSSIPHGLVVKVIYRGDAESQYITLPCVDVDRGPGGAGGGLVPDAQDDDGGAGEGGDGNDQSDGGGGDGGDGGGSPDERLKRFVKAHFLLHFKASLKQHPGAIYSICFADPAVEDAATVLKTLPGDV